VNGRNEVCLTIFQSLIHKKILVGGDNHCLILNPSLTTTTKLFLFLLQHLKTEMKKKTIFPFSNRSITCLAIFSIVSRYFAEILVISLKYHDIFSAIFRLAENIMIFSIINDISPILSSLSKNKKGKCEIKTRQKNQNQKIKF